MADFGPILTFDSDGNRRIVEMVRRIENTPQFPPNPDPPPANEGGILQAFQVSNNSTSNYVTASPYIYNGSTGFVTPYNFSIATTVAHSIGDLIYALPVSCSTGHLVDRNSLPILLQEVSLSTGGGEIPVLLSQTGGAQAQQIGGTWYPASWRYTVMDLNSNILALDVPAYFVRSPLEVSPAVTGTVVYAPQLSLASPGHTPGSGSGSGSGSGNATPYRLWWADEPLLVQNACSASSGGSGSGS